MHHWLFILAMYSTPTMDSKISVENAKRVVPKWTQDDFYEAQALGLGDMVPAAIIVVVAIVAIAVGTYVVSTLGGLFVANSQAANVTTQGTLALAQFSKWFIIIVVVVAAAIVIGLLIRSFYGTGGAGGSRRQ